MAKLFKGIFGPFSGQIGSVVGARWKNVSYVRSAPRRKKKKKKPTPAQLANQQKFKFVQEWLVPFYPFITIGFQNEAINKTEINAAFSYSYKNVVTGTYPNLGIDYQHVLVSKGSLTGLANIELSRPQRDLLSVTWEQNYQSYGVYDDQIMLVVYSPALKMADGFIGGAKRADKECVFSLNTKMAAEALEVYISVMSLSGKRMANSVYLGRMEAL